MYRSLFKLIYDPDQVEKKNNMLHVLIYNHDKDYLIFKRKYEDHNIVA